MSAKHGKRTIWTALLLSTVLLLAGCSQSRGGGEPDREPESTPRSAASANNSSASQPKEGGEVEHLPALEAGKSYIFVEQSNGADDGVERLMALMESRGQPFYRTGERPEGLIAADDVVVLKINCQWAERGGTNTDLIRSVALAVLDHPEGFSGEIIVADNGQAQYGTGGAGGSLDWANPNSLNRDQSALDVIRELQAQGHPISGMLWDQFTAVRVEEFAAGDREDGFVVEKAIRATGLEISYPKFTTQYGTMVSFREGVWDPETASYDSGRLKVINLPVLKSHSIYQVTGAVKAYMGVVSDVLTEHRAHASVGQGGMGTQMAHSRVPALNIMDMIWIAPDGGPGSGYALAEERNLIAASTDPVALDVWASRYVLMPAAAAQPGGREARMDPHGMEPGTFGYWLSLSAAELRAAGYPVSVEESEMVLVAGEGVPEEYAKLEG